MASLPNLGLENTTHIFIMYYECKLNYYTISITRNIN